MGLFAHQCLGPDPSGGLIAGIEWRRREVGHRGQIPRGSLTDRRGLAPQNIGLTLAALFLKMGVERLPATDFPIALKPAVDDLGEPVKLRPRHGDRPLISGRNRERHHLGNAVARDVEMPRRLSLAHALGTGRPNLQIQVHGKDSPTLPDARKGKGGRLSRRQQQVHPAANVADFCTAFLTLYEHFGYWDLTHRAMVDADGDWTGDDWLLMGKPLMGATAPWHAETTDGSRGMIDRAALERLQEALGDDPADLVDLLETFLSDAPEIVDLMDAAADAADLDVVRRQAHSLKSNARDMGATALAGLCASLEGDLRDGRDPGDLKGRVAGVREEWTRVARALTEEIERLGVAE